MHNTLDVLELVRILAKTLQKYGPALKILLKGSMENENWMKKSKRKIVG